MDCADVLELIARKRDGLPLRGEAVASFVRGYVRGEIPDYQASALLMAVFLRGMDAAETAALTRAMLDSGLRLAWRGGPGKTAPRVGDKHSTGGVGDKTSFLVGPICAAAGVAVPMVAGRGLGHTGGTVDKLEAVPGLRTALSPEEITAQVGGLGLCIAAQSAQIAPADRKLYALRDVTSTVESIPLIAASIMSKKLAEGLDALVLDVKCGRGAFMKELPRARELAEALVGIGREAGVRVTALLTAMDQPLGAACGNGVELEEACAILRGERPPLAEDVRALSLELSAQLIFLAGAAWSVDEARGLSRRVLESGRAYELFCRMVAAQGGDPAALEPRAGRPSGLPQALDRMVVTAPRSGHVHGCDALAVGRACVRLGAGRCLLGEAVDPAAGVVLFAKEGDFVEPGAPLAELRAADTARLAAARPLVESAFTLEDEHAGQAPLVRGLVSTLPGP
ncbi:pyrimidine-nucleoside phosphorylase [Desulfovibrio sp. X2]|uniref:thymidine phosphorylase n=1 Tax=Desulfovibrio sp. X2 TaxID=941449 RepID=UPI0003586EC1|nr:thymidine phosphorylase [Desulfovibrio sp. X2]EPR44757.1 pyrimidine-nucleoside phosphorylase [Desulfovibrio sp. X2]